MQLDYAIEGYWLAKRRDFSANTVNDYTLTFRRLTEFVGKTRDLQGTAIANSSFGGFPTEMGSAQEPAIRRRPPWTRSYIITVSAVFVRTLPNAAAGAEDAAPSMVPGRDSDRGRGRRPLLLGQPSGTRWPRW